MKWSSHAEISRCVAEALGLPPDLEQLLVKASLDPDRNALRMSKDGRGGEERVRIRHHEPPRSELMRFLWKARRARLEGRNEDAVWCTGRALHYVQDMHVRTGPFMLTHDRAEAEIARCPPRLEAAIAGARSALPSPHYVKVCLDKAGPMRDPREALDSATMLSAAIAGAVLSDQAPSPAVLSEWRRNGSRHRFLALPVAIGGPLVLAALAFASGSPYYSVLGIPIFLAVLGIDSRYYYDRKEARWFGLTM